MFDIDPSVWGPPFWKTLHFVALGFPDKATPFQREKFRVFFDDTLPFLIPCSACRQNYRRHLRELSSQASSRFSSARALFDWTVSLHNLVNRENNAPQLTPDQALEKLMSKPNQSNKSSSLDGGGMNVVMIMFVFIVGALVGGLVAFGVGKRSEK